MSETKSIKGTETEKNLVVAYLAESSAYTRYTYYAAQAQKEGYIPVQLVFEMTALNELRHGKVFFKMLQGGRVEVPMTPDAGVIGDTLSNLKTAMAEEEREGVEFYTKSAEVARQEGFPEIAAHFDAIAAVEKHHHDRFARFIDFIETDTLWRRDTSVTWTCNVCGYTFTGQEPPRVCPACDHPYQHYYCAADFD